MATEYSIETCKQLAAAVKTANLHRPMRMDHYDAGMELEYEATPVEPGETVRVSVLIDKFVGGGFAGQVYKVILTRLEVNGEVPIEVGNLKVGNNYAMKILIPPSTGSLFFRNCLYAIGFQAPFQLQVNPTAARAGALWQKFIRAAARHRFEDEKCVNDIHATFVDSDLGSCGEFSDWVDGRTWRLEVDDYLDTLKRWRKGKAVDESTLGSTEFRSKYTFMTCFVELLHEVGAHEFARQYEWTTCKSQPNALKRTDTEDDPTAGLIAVDFRAGLALLPCLPMSPGDFKLIWQGLKRGSLVQFDRGNLETLEKHIQANPEMYQSLENSSQMLAELKACEKVYRDSIPDLTHNHLRLLYDGGLWNSLFDSAVTGWKTRNLFDAEKETVFRNSKLKTMLFFLLGLIPILGRIGRKVWAKADWRKHYVSMLSSISYFGRAIKGKIAEKLISWHRAGRVDAQTALELYKTPIRFFLHLPVSIFPAGMHRFMTDPNILKGKLYFFFVRPLKLYFNAHLREEWLRDMVAQGKKKHILSDEDADTILSQVNEPYIQKYLVSLVVHLMTLPVTQVVGLIIAVINWQVRDLTWDEATAQGAVIMLALQVVPLSPGSFCRGAYTTLMAIRDRNFKDYNIALFLSYFKYVGYLAFPIQMTYRYPALARFMAAHWATDAVHIVPVFGERGALLEHWIFCLFYNWPLTLRRKMKRISEIRTNLPTRLWHIPVTALVTTAVFALAHALYYSIFSIGSDNDSSCSVPCRDNFWYLKPLFWLVILLSAVSGGIITRYAGGLARSRRIVLSAICGGSIGLYYTLAAFGLEHYWDLDDPAFLMPMIWRAFAMAIFFTIGALIAEIRAPDPDIK